MSYIFDSRLGEQLYYILPEVYRSRDKISQGNYASGNNDLAKYLDVHGYLLDIIHATLDQQLKDALPATCQEWLLPYFAQLLATNIVSPDPEGKHGEISNAISWRQRKGTLTCIEEIAETIGQMEVEIQEGWKRVAVTPRMCMPLMQASVMDDTLDIDLSIPNEASKHPGLPAVMVDFRSGSRSVEAKSSNPAARLSSFRNIKQTWRQLNVHGVPCFPNSYNDSSLRTVDIRTPDDDNGRYHHKRLLAYTPPPPGLFPYETITLTWAELHDSLYEHLIEEFEENGEWVIRNTTSREIAISDNVHLSPARPYRVQGFTFKNKLSVEDGGKLVLDDVVATEVQVDTFSTDIPVLTAAHCAFQELSVGNGLAKLDGCTTRDIAYLSIVDAMNCIFMAIDGSSISGVIQYSRIPPGLEVNPEILIVDDCTTDNPVWFEFQDTLQAKVVLAPNTPKSIYSSAKDNREMGYYYQGRTGRPIRIKGDFVATNAISLPPEEEFRLNDLVFEGSLELNTGRFSLARSAALSLQVKSPELIGTDGDEIPLVYASDSIFETITVDNGLLRMEYCNVMLSANCKRLQASDCIFIGSITDGGAGEPEAGCIRYSRIPESLIGNTLNINTGYTSTNTHNKPIFMKYDYCEAGVFDKRYANYGESGFSVLNTKTPTTIKFGAEDGGEMGAYHHMHYCLKVEAVMEKMHQFLPVGIEPVLIFDRQLLHVPPEINN